MRLHLDFETGSDLDLTEVGASNYISHPSTRALLLAYAYNDGPVQLHDFTLDPDFPAPLRAAVEAPHIQKIAWNAPFEIAVLDKLFSFDLDLRHWLDPMIVARYLSFPGSLGAATEALGLNTAKDKRGKELIRLFSCPNKTTAAMRKAGAGDTYRPDRRSHPDEWRAFAEYARTDVESMREALRAMESYTSLPASEHLLWRLDQAINDRGLPVDYAYVRHASTLMDASDAETLMTLGRVTGCTNPNSVAQLKNWLAEWGHPMSSVAAGAVIEELDGELPPEVREVLLARQQLGGAGPKSWRRSRRLFLTMGGCAASFLLWDSHGPVD